MARRFKIQFVCDFRQGHVCIYQQFLGVLQLCFVDVLRNGAMHVFLKKTGKLWIAVRHFRLRRLDLLGSNQGVVELADEIL